MPEIVPIADELREQLWRKAAIVLRQHFNLNVAEATSNLVDAIIPIIAAREASARREGDEVAQKLRAAAEAVCWFDWSSNDPDAAAAVDHLREALSLSPAIPAAGGGDEGWRPRSMDSAPRDGTPVLLKTPNGWAEAWYSKGAGLTDSPITGPDYEGPAWVCCDDTFQVEIEETPEGEISSASAWLPLPPPASAPNPGPGDEIAPELAQLRADMASASQRALEADNPADRRVIEQHRYNLSLRVKELEAQRPNPGPGDASKHFVNLARNKLRSDGESRCRSDSDGDCDWPGCPQLRDGEPTRSGRHCPLDRPGDDDGTQEVGT